MENLKHLIPPTMGWFNIVDIYLHKLLTRNTDRKVSRERSG